MLQESLSLATWLRESMAPLPVYAARAVSKLLWQVSIVTGPEKGAVQLYHTEFSPSDALSAGRWSGSPFSLVAASFMPGTLKVAPLSDFGEAKSSARGLTYADSAMLILYPVAVPPARVSFTSLPLSLNA